MKEEIFVARDGKKLSLYVWDEVPTPFCAVQIIHGMGDCGDRYGALASFLNKKGIIVYSSDLRGHGKTDEDNHGYGYEGNSFEETTSDVMEIAGYMKSKYSLPIFLLGYSYGASVAMRYLTYTDDKIRGIILCSALYLSSLYSSAYHLLTAIKSSKPNPNKQTIFDRFDKKIGEGCGSWLNRDKEEIDKFKTHPLCSFPCSKDFMISFAKGQKSIARAEYKKVNKNVRVLVLAGSDDVLSNSGKNTLKLVKRYLKKGFKTDYAVYENARHDILHEINKYEVYDDIYSFIVKSANFV